MVADDQGKPLPNISVFINKKNYKTDIKGEINYEGYIENIKIEDENYFYYDENIEKDGFYKIVLSKIKIHDIQGVIILKKDSIINAYKPKREMLSFACSSLNTNNISVLVNFKINNKIKIKNYSFFIMSDEKYNVPFRFVIYRKNGDYLEKIVAKEISTYFKNDNTIDLSSDNIYIERGEYFFGMEWIINDVIKTKTIRTMSKKYPDIKYIGQDLGGSMKNPMENQTFFYNNNGLKPSVNKSFQQLKISL